MTKSSYVTIISTISTCDIPYLSISLRCIVLHVRLSQIQKENIHKCSIPVNMLTRDQLAYVKIKNKISEISIEHVKCLFCMWLRVKSPLGPVKVDLYVHVWLLDFLRSTSTEGQDCVLYWFVKDKDWLRNEKLSLVHPDEVSSHQFILIQNIW